MIKLGLDVEVRRALLSAAAADLDAPAGKVQTQGDDATATDPTPQAGWALAFGASEATT